jgi:hypothetical protein
MRALLGAVVMGVLTSAAWAAPEVKFGDVSRFADFGDSVLERERNERELSAFLMALSQRLPAGQELQFEVKDVNLAGELEWLFGSAQRLRVMRNVTLPYLEFGYVLSEGGKRVREETVQLRDLDYLNNVPARWRNESLGFEKAMLERWFLRTFKTR